MLVEFPVAEGKMERSRKYPRGGRAAAAELSWSGLLEGTLREWEQSQKSEGNILHFIDFVDRLK